MTTNLKSGVICIGAFMLAITIVVIGMIILFGSVPVTEAPVKPVVKTITFETTSHTFIEYGWYEVKGTITNNGNSKHSVAIYTDFYDKNNVKIDHVLDFVNVDANGSSAFECTTTKEDTAFYKTYIDHYY